MKELEPKTEKTFPTERVFRAVEFIERSYTTEPKLRIRRGHNITIRRCYMVASILKRMGFNEGDKVTRTDLENACDRAPGMDRRTHNRYIGFCIYSRGRDRRLVKRVKGYLERLRIVFPVGNGLFKVSFFAVPLSFLKGSKHTIANLCVPKSNSGSYELRMEKELVAPTIKTTQQQQHNTHTNQLSESNILHKNVKTPTLTPLEKAILRVSKECEAHG